MSEAISMHETAMREMKKILSGISAYLCKKIHSFDTP